MSRILTLKKTLERIPEPIGRWARFVPYGWRLGPTYRRMRQQILGFDAMDVQQRRAVLLPRLQRVVREAYRDIPFYRAFYDSHQFDPAGLRTWDDFQRVPILTKADLWAVPLDQRTRPARGMLKLNTGGTSGQPLAFYVDRHAFAREWAHMHTVWGRLGYHQKQLKLTFRGKNLGDAPIRYNPVHHEFLVNAYARFDVVAAAVRDVLGRRDVTYLHGYPSALSDFARYCRDEAPDLAHQLRQTLKGVLLGSEFPAPAYRTPIEQVFTAPSISWYGHSEMAILAMEREPFVYAPMQTYGYCETVADEAGRHRLIGTSYHNDVAPLIRYDTGDAVEPRTEQGLLDRFEVLEGRLGDFVQDAQGRQISLTALVFGRHHQVFSWARYVQIHQPRPGETDVLLTVAPNDAHTPADAERDFDTSHIAMRFRFVIRTEPIRTPAGKVPLLVQTIHDPTQAQAHSVGQQAGP